MSSNLDKIFEGETVSEKWGKSVVLYDGIFSGEVYSEETLDGIFARFLDKGIACVRFAFAWEHIEISADEYNEDYLAYLRRVMKKAEAYTIKVILLPLQKNWCSAFSGFGAPLWTLKCFNDKNSANFNRLFWQGKAFEPELNYDGLHVQDFLQEHFIAAMNHTARRLKMCKAVIGFELFQSLQFEGLETENFEAQYLVPFYQKFIEALEVKHKQYVFFLNGLSDFSDLLLNADGENRTIEKVFSVL